MGEKCRSSRTVSGGFKSGLSARAVALLSVSGSIAATLIVGFFCFSRETFQRALNWEFAADRDHHSGGQAPEKIPGPVDAIDPNLHMPGSSLLGPYAQ